MKHPLQGRDAMYDACDKAIDGLVTVDKEEGADDVQQL